MATASVFPPAANIVWSDARGSYGIANAELIYWPARSGLHLVTHDEEQRRMLLDLSGGDGQ